MFCLALLLACVAALADTAEEPACAGCAAALQHQDAARSSMRSQDTARGLRELVADNKAAFQQLAEAMDRIAAGLKEQKAAADKAFAEQKVAVDKAFAEQKVAVDKAFVEQRTAAAVASVEQRAAADRAFAEQKVVADKAFAEQKVAVDKAFVEQKSSIDGLKSYTNFFIGISLTTTVVFFGLALRHPQRAIQILKAYIGVAHDP